MASAFGHAASIIGYKKMYPDQQFGKKILMLGIISSIFPDLDVINSDIGIPTHGAFDFLGHRGFTHSIFFAFIWAIVLLFVFHRKDHLNKYVLGFFYFSCMASHGVLDAMTTGGDGIMLFWPFENGRYFSPYRPILVSPLGVKYFFSEWGLEVLMSEAKYIGIPSLFMYLTGLFLNKKIYR